MFAMAVGHSDEVDPAEAIAAAIEQCRATLDGRPPQAGILFASFDSYEPSIVAAVRRRVPGRPHHGLHLVRRAVVDRRLPGGLDGAGAVRVGRHRHHRGPGNGHRPGCGRGVPGGGRAGPGGHHARATDLHRARGRLQPSTRSWCWTAWRVRCPTDVVILGGTSARNSFAVVSPTSSSATMSRRPRAWRCCCSPGLSDIRPPWARAGSPSDPWVRSPGPRTEPSTRWTDCRPSTSWRDIST